MLEPLRPSKNPILRREARLLWHDLLRQPMFWVVVLAAFGHLGFSVLLLLGFSERFDAYSQYYLQFTFFHSIVYFAPPFFIFFAWRRWRRSTRFEEMYLTGASAADLFWAFVLTRCGLLFGLIALFYIPMLPWENWWLLRFEEGDVVSLTDDSWTRLHFLITWLYFISAIFFGVIGGIWIQERRHGRAGHNSLRDSFASNLFLDLIAYFVVLKALPNASFSDLISWPDFLAVLLELHATPWFGPPYAALKIILTLLMARTVIKGLGPREP
ncbi:hypothetical protein KQI84_03280 [bacterium]|nr:hypothetical protein [bacterium]